MPVPSDITALSAIAASNSPLGSESPATADDYFRAHAAFIAQLRAVIGGASDADIPNAYATTVQVNDYVANQSQNSGTTGGTLTAYTLAPVTAITSYAANKTFWVKFHVASGASPTIQISGISSPPTLVRQSAAGTYAAIGAGEIPAGHLSRVTLLSATQALVEDMPPPADVSSGALQTDGVQVGQSATASNNFTWRNLLDGLLRLSRGNAGSPITDVMLVNADNSVSFPGNVASGVLGAGQTWQDLTASRSAGVTYTNTTGRPILVLPHLQHGGGAYFTAIVTINGIAVAHLNAGNATYSQVFPYAFIVPAGGTYVLTLTGGGGTMGKWSELR